MPSQGHPSPPVHPLPGRSQAQGAPPRSPLRAVSQQLLGLCIKHLTYTPYLDPTSLNVIALLISGWD